jgi:hypothetical protein
VAAPKVVNRRPRKRIHMGRVYGAEGHGAKVQGNGAEVQVPGCGCTVAEAE